jgi:heme-degrading monooxygenase HmoA
MFVALSKFVLANDTAPAVKEAFRQRPHAVESASGFVRMDVISPEIDPREIWLITYWTSREHFDAWHRSHLYRESHSGIPKGIKLVARKTSLMFFEYVGS